MRIIYAALVVATLLSSSVDARAQSPVSSADVAVYEGTWVLDVVRSGQAVAEQRVITAGPTSMQVDIHRAQDARPISLIYNFDGSPTSNAFGEGTAVSRLTRDPNGLLLQTVFTVRNHPITVHELLPMYPDGSELAIAVMLRVEHGYQGVAPAGARTPPNISKGTKIFQKQP